MRVCVVCVHSEMTTPVVIQTLLDKFLITDSCQKFALYEKINNEHPKTPGLIALETVDSQGAPWSWEVMEFRKTIFQA